ncbi:MAG: glycosyltransferase family 2 protein [Candidatus Wallbacteria bacterium]|nr:glycosyltransferase family 2 protein [Candidatus Wallbacteria bacterium]
MRISIVTVVRNSVSTIGQCLDSVSGQTCGPVEHIVIDGGSTDGTLEVLRKRNEISALISEPDHGIYDALNKGVSLATGDVIATLNSDDVYASNDVLEKVAAAFERTGCDALYGDLLFMNRDLTRAIRFWKSGLYDSASFASGWVPPFPALFLKRTVYNRFGLFDSGFQISGDYEFMLRVLMRHGVSAQYLPEVLVKMRSGGKSSISFSSLLLRTRENIRAWRMNGYEAGPYTILLKYIRKIPQFSVMLSQIRDGQGL